MLTAMIFWQNHPLAAYVKVEGWWHPEGVPSPLHALQCDCVGESLAVGGQPLVERREMALTLPDGAAVEAVL